MLRIDAARLSPARASAARLAVLLSLAVIAQSAAAFGAAPASQPATLPADRTTPTGTLRLYDQTAADTGVDGAIKFYHCTSAAQRRYARSECEYFVALNRLVRSARQRLNDDIAAAARRTLGDDDDYAAMAADIAGDSATLQRTGRPPMQMIRIDDLWQISMPDWFAVQSKENLESTRQYYESAADQIDAVREQIEAGKIKTATDLEEQLQKIATSR